MANVIERNNVQIRGAGDRAMVFAHGFGCDQNMWRFVAPAFEKDFMTVVFDTSAPADLICRPTTGPSIQPCPITPTTWSKSAPS
ncbi:hypothetical protein ACVIWV_007887 [Bradyrhizobium diazoefficiens]